MRVCSCVLALIAAVCLAFSVSADGTVWTWGDNTYGQLGDGTTDNKFEPTAVPDIPIIIYAAAGRNHTLAVDVDGNVWAWGRNNSGQLGDGTTTDSPDPVQVAGMTGVLQVAAGEDHTLALKSDGSVWAWGGNGSGQLGDGSNDDSLVPVQVSDIDNIIAITAGDGFSMALDGDSGAVWSWGSNASGILGDDSGVDQNSPVQVSGLTEVVFISANSTNLPFDWHHALAVKGDGTVWAWGSNFRGKLGDGTTTNRPTPVQVVDMADAIAVAAGTEHSLALKSDGTVWSWGDGSGLGYEIEGLYSATPGQVDEAGEIFTNIVAVAAGANHSLALEAEGGIWAWGANNDGQLGDGSATFQRTPVAVLDISDAVSISSKLNHSLASSGVSEVEDQFQLTVTSSPKVGMRIGGKMNGVTEYSLMLDADEKVILTAPGAARVDNDKYSFVRWYLNGVPQDEGRNNIQFKIDENTLAEAEYMPM